MGFSETFIKNASDEVVSISMQKDYDYIEKILQKAVNNAAKKSTYFNAKDVVIYLQGSYACKTNTKFQSKLEVVVEVTKTREYDYETLSLNEFKMRDNFFVDFNHYFNVKHFKEVLIDEITQILKINIHNTATNIIIPSFGTLQHSIDIFPCFKYKYFTPDGGSIRCKLVYDRKLGEHYLIFTNMHAVNGQLKDEITKGNFKRMVRLFKNLVAISLREDGCIQGVRGYYIECLLYNVPNEMYYAADGKLASVFLKVINWLNFADLGDFVCQNQIWSFWGNADGFWNQHEARQFINDVIRFYETFPVKRIEIIKEEPAE